MKQRRRGTAYHVDARDLIASGDVISKVEGIFSGTLSYLFNSFDGSIPFSALVRTAYQTGLTEPDPRDDLSGQDVARSCLFSRVKVDRNWKSRTSMLRAWFLEVWH